MRKIEQEMINAIENGSNWRKDNTEVFKGTDGRRSVTLHGNTIAFETSQGWYITASGWNTSTTRSRLRALSHVIGSDLFKGVYSKNGQLFINYGTLTISVKDNESFCIG